jgi:F-type H+-transporting ATPase subunit epsilon
VVYSGEADSVVLPAWQGEMGILAGHADFVVLLKRGLVRFEAKGSSRTIPVAGGFAEVSHNQVVVLPDEVGDVAEPAA